MAELPDLQGMGLPALRELQDDLGNAIAAAIKRRRILPSTLKGQTMTERLTRSDLIDHVAAGHAVTKDQARRIVDTMLGFILDAVAVGDTVVLNGFGRFELRSRAARTGRNPRTGVAVEIAATDTMVFRASRNAGVMRGDDDLPVGPDAGPDAGQAA